MAENPLNLSCSYHCYHQMSFLYRALQDMYHRKELCDVFITIGSSIINAHRVVLAAFSPYFHYILTKNMDNQSQTEITLTNLNEEAVKAIVDFCYTSTITVTSESATELLSASQILQIEEITKLCDTFLAAQQAFDPLVSSEKKQKLFQIRTNALPTWQKTQSTNVVTGSVDLTGSWNNIMSNRRLQTPNRQRASSSPGHLSDRYATNDSYFSTYGSDLPADLGLDKSISKADDGRNIANSKLVRCRNCSSRTRSTRPLFSKTGQLPDSAVSALVGSSFRESNMQAMAKASAVYTQKMPTCTSPNEVCSNTRVIKASSSTLLNERHLSHDHTAVSSTFTMKPDVNEDEDVVTMAGSSITDVHVRQFAERKDMDVVSISDYGRDTQLQDFAEPFIKQEPRDRAPDLVLQDMLTSQNPGVDSIFAGFDSHFPYLHLPLDLTGNQCPLCKRTFRSVGCVRKHLQTHYNQYVMNTTTGKTQILDTLNYDGTSGETSLSHPRHGIDKNTPVTCPLCSQTFRDERSLKFHRRTHTKKYFCNVCGKRFSHTGNLHRHRRTHTGERPYKCPHCSKTFAGSSDLQIHIRIHLGEKPYKCNQCGECFVSITRLQWHVKRIHGLNTMKP